MIILVFAVLSLAADLFPGESWTSGIISLNADGDDMFYMLFKARNKNTHAPLVLWLTGGPGCSLSNGLIEENGPYLIGWDLVFKRNPYSWNNQVDMLYVDNPVGTGYSKANTLCTNKECVTRNLYTFISKFITINPTYINRPFYITGESYAGHYIAGISAYLVKAKNSFINFKGSAIGNGLVNAIEQYNQYANYLFENRRLSNYYYALSQFETITLCDSQIRLKSKLMEPLCGYTVGMEIDRANIINIYNINLSKNDDDIMNAMYQFMTVNKIFFNLPNDQRDYSVCNDTVSDYLDDYDWFEDYSGDVAYAVDHGLPMLVYSGDLDLICNWMGGMAWMHAMKWSGSKQFNKLSLSPYMYNGKQYGAIKTYGKLSFLRVFNAGHLVPMDQGEFSMQMLYDFIANTTTN